MDNGPVNIELIAAVDSTGSMDPSSTYIDITAEFNDMVNAGIDKHIGWRVRGDPGDPPQFLTVKLEIYWQ